jgi:hypothetical protein
LKASLEELGITFEVESIQTPDAVETFEAKVAGQMPVRAPGVNRLNLRP